MCTIRFSVFLDQETDREQFDTFTTFEKFSLKLNVRVEKTLFFWTIHGGLERGKIMK